MTDSEHSSHSGSSGSSTTTLALAIIAASAILGVSIVFSANTLVSSNNALIATLARGVPAAGNNPTAAPTAAPTTVIQPTAQAPVNIDLAGRPVRGDPNAKVTIVEFSDFECPFCQRAFPTVEQVMTDYDGKVKFAYRHFPLSFHPRAEPAAIAYECAVKVGGEAKGWEYHDVLFKRTDETILEDAGLKKAAKDLGINEAQFNTCYDNKETKAIVDADFALGTQSGVDGTPTFFINGQALVGAQPYSAFKTAIDAALAA